MSDIIKIASEDWVQEQLKELGGGAGGVSSWNDLQDRPFYEDGVKEKILLDEISFEFTEEDNCYYGESILDIKEGKEYIITYDDNQYTCKAWYYEDWESMMLGNGAAIEEDELGDDVPFLVEYYGEEYYGEEYGDWYLYAEIGRRTIKITEVVPNIKIIEEKFLPKSALAQADWNQNDNTQPDFIKNKPFFSEDAESREIYVDFYHVKYDDEDSNYSYYIETNAAFVYDKDFMYKLTLNDVAYEMYAEMINKNHYHFGAPYNAEINEYDFSKYNFSIDVTKKFSANGVWDYKLSVPKTDKWSETRLFVTAFYVNNHKLDDKYLVNPDWSENDPRKASCIIDKPFGDNMPTGKYESVLFDGNIELDEYGWMMTDEPLMLLKFPEVGKLYDVVVNGHIYNSLQCYIPSSHGYLAYMTDSFSYIGQDKYGGYNLEVPFCISIRNNNYADFNYDYHDTSLTLPGTVHLTIYEHKCETKKLDEKYLPQSDWNEVNDTKGTFISNKPFGEYLEKTVETIVRETTVTTTEKYTNFECSSNSVFVGEKYTVVFNGKEYNGLECYIGDNDSECYIGVRQDELKRVDIPYPFSIKCTSPVGYIYWNSVGEGHETTVTFALYREIYETKVKTIDPKYFPDNIGSGVTSWNDLEDKPFYDEHLEVIVSTPVTFVADSNVNYTKYICKDMQNIVTLPDAFYENYQECKFLLGDRVFENIEYVEYYNQYIGHDKNDLRLFIMYPGRGHYDSWDLWLDDCPEDENSIMNTTFSIVAPTPLKQLDAKYLPEPLQFGEIYYSTGDVLQEFNDIQNSYGVLNSTLIEGKLYKVIYDETEYECLARNDGYGDIYIGNQTVSDGWGFPETIISDEPFFIFTYVDGDYIDSEIRFTDELEHSISIININQKYTTIDSKYLPEHLQFGEEKTLTPFWNEGTFDFMTYTNMPYYFYNQSMPNNLLIVGDTYTVVWDGVEYPDLVCEYGGYNGYECIGATMSTAGDGSVGNEYPFSINVQKYMGDDIIAYIATNDDSATHTIAIYKQDENIKTIDTKYLPTTSWNDLEDRPFYETEAIEEVLIPETVVSNFVNTDYFSGNYYYESRITVDYYTEFSLDKTYTVIWDGVKYDNVTCQSTLGGNMLGSTGRQISGAYGDNNEYPFGIIMYNGNESSELIIAAEVGQSQHTVKVVDIIKESEIKTIDPKYLPKNIGGALTSWNEEVEIVPLTEFVMNPDYYEFNNENVPRLKNGQELIVLLDNIAYTVVVQNENNYPSVNLNLNGKDIQIGFYARENVSIYEDTFFGNIQLADGKTHTIQIKGIFENHEVLPKEYKRTFYIDLYVQDVNRVNATINDITNAVQNGYDVVMINHAGGDFMPLISHEGVSNRATFVSEHAYESFGYIYSDKIYYVIDDDSKIAKTYYCPSQFDLERECLVSNEVVLYSPSFKRFRLAVDDDGTLITEEIVDVQIS